MNFNLKQPCGNCPFRREGAIELTPGRLQGIVSSLMKDDLQVFPCHKTTHGPKGGEWTDEEGYVPSGQEEACAGALSYLCREGRAPVLFRLQVMQGLWTRADIEAIYPKIIENLKCSKSRKKS